MMYVYAVWVKANRLPVGLVEFGGLFHFKRRETRQYQMCTMQSTAIILPHEEHPIPLAFGPA